MLIYFLLTLIIFYFLYLSRVTVVREINEGIEEDFIARNKITLSIWFVILLGLASLKGIKVGVDYPMYYDFFRHNNYAGIIEPAVSFIYGLAQKYDSFYIFSFSVYFLFLFFIFLGIKKNSPNYLISILCLVMMHIYFTSFNQIRQMIAVSIIFCFVNYLITNKHLDKIKYLLIILLALLFHNSAIFLLLLFFIPQRKFSPKVVLPLFVLTIVLYFIPEFKNQIGKFLILVSGAYADKYASYLTYFFEVNKDKGLLQLIPVMVQMLIVAVSLYFPKNTLNVNINYKLYHFSANIVVIYLCLYSLAGIEAVDRLQIYFSSFNIYFYSYLLHLLLNCKEKFFSRLFILLIIVFWILYYSLRLIINVHGIVPYSLF